MTTQKRKFPGRIQIGTFELSAHFCVTNKRIFFHHDSLYP